MSYWRMRSRVPHLASLVLAAGLTLGCDDGGGSEEAEPPPSTLLPSMFGTPDQQGVGSSSEQYYKAPVTRDGVEYMFMANGWGPGFISQTVSHNGTAFTVESMDGTQGENYQP